MANGLLAQIANPQIANIPGQFAAGEQVGRTRRLQGQAQQLGQLQPGVEQQTALRSFAAEAPEQAAAIQQVFRGIDQGNLQSAFHDIAAAAAVSGEQQKDVLRLALPKLAGNQAIQQGLQGIIDNPEQVEVDTELFEIMQLGVTMGALPGGGKATKTAGQIEREVVVTEKAQKTREEALEIKRLQTEQAATSKLSESDQKQVNVLRKTVDDFSKSFRQVEEAENRISKVGSRGTPASDLALIFNFMKMLDPGSVVRESEFRTAEQAKAWLVRQEGSGITVPAPISNAIRKATKGTILEPAQRIDFLDQAAGLFTAQRESTDNQINNVLERADQDNLPRVRVLGAEALAGFNIRQASAAEQKQPQETQPDVQEGQVIVNQQTGERMQLVNGQFVRIQ